MEQQGFAGRGRAYNVFGLDNAGPPDKTEEGAQGGRTLLLPGRGSFGRGASLLRGRARQNTAAIGRGTLFQKLLSTRSGDTSESSSIPKADVSEVLSSATESFSEDLSSGTALTSNESSGINRGKTDSGFHQTLSSGGITGTSGAIQVRPAALRLMQTEFSSVSLGRGFNMPGLGRGLCMPGAKPSAGITPPVGQKPNYSRLEGSVQARPHEEAAKARASSPQSSISGKTVQSIRMSPVSKTGSPEVIQPSVSLLPGKKLSSGRGVTLRHHRLESTLGSVSARSDSASVATVTTDKSETLTKRDPLVMAERAITEYHGSSGVEIPTRVNCVRVNCKNPAIYQYHVSFRPDVDSRQLRFSLINQHRDFIGHKAFDGSILYLTKDIGQDRILVSERITDGVKISLKIQMTAKLNPASHKLTPFYNVVMHKVMKILKLCPVGRNYYDPACPKSVEKYRLDLWPGYVTAVREMEGGLYLNIDCSFKVLRNETVLQQMQELYKTSRGDFRSSCIKELVGVTVLTRYNNNNYRIDDIDWSLSPMSTFTTSKGETISFFDYYKSQYGIEIKDLKQPMLINRPKRATQRHTRAEKGEERVLSLVPELCCLTGISDKLAGDFSAMKDIGAITRMGPVNRNLHVEQFLHRVNSSAPAREELLKWGLELESTCAAVTSRVLPAEKVMVGGNKVFPCNEQVDFFRDISRAPMLRSVPLKNWIIVFTSRDQSKARDFATKFHEVSRCIGMPVQPPELIELKSDRSDEFKHAISGNINKNLQLVVCIFPTLREDRYSTVKRLCCVEKPVPSQVIISRTLPKDSKMGKFRSVTMKIALQINCKLGGELWAVSIPLDGLMVCGIDVYHEGKGGKGRSVAAFVASMNKLVTRWHSRAIQQHLPNQEIIDGLKQCFCDAITKYYESNHKLPERIIIYRDGVGDGQLSMVAEHEVQQLKDAMKMFNDIAGGVYAPKFTFVVVSKRINVRYFKKEGNNLVNPPPGAVLDHTATRPNWPDFYLISQHVRQGTVSPTHYIVVDGSANMKPDHLQRLTYKLTHMYYNWPGTVRVPAPCQYAHKLAYLVGENIRSEPSRDLCDRLFYL